MVLCAACKFWQHALCFGIRHQDEAPDRHICDSCANVSLHKSHHLFHMIVFLRTSNTVMFR